MVEEESTEITGAPDTCERCRHYGFSFSCVEGYCTSKGTPVDGLTGACEEFEKEVR